MIGSGFYDADFRKAILINADVSSTTFEGVLINGAKLSGVKGILEATIKSIDVGTRENPIIIEGNQAVQCLLSRSLLD
ncbi:pentapeptide repeat-containing protein [Clostridium bornimense]|uniref:pentapeptide repeat-containing protein n=1 Tax=Clostridium bornimense TaxID=1216932 RepID=UPI001C117578|nr:pentapeptide repeat-containing protein [Clostridium bornimense]MBU5316073.1 pentapeptide repeat-containing protein [Clostridium bornimense]